VTQLCVQYLGRPVPVIVHGYDHPVPDGRGVLGGFGPLPGPWLEPGFREKGYGDLGQRIALAAELIDRFNTMIGEVSALPEFAHVHHIDLRNTLSNTVVSKYSADSYCRLAWVQRRRYCHSCSWRFPDGSIGIN